jgi:hypothetical protein
LYIKEVASSLYPWDLADQGVERCVDNVVEHALVNSVYLVGIMHKEKRPLTSHFYTLNPKRKFYIPEDSRVYYRMDEKNFAGTPMKPLYSERSFLKGSDWLDTLTEYGRKRGLKTGVEISHTFFDSDVAREQFPDVFQKDLDGNPLVRFFCSNNSKVREYMRAIFYDSVKNHDVDFIQTCLMLFQDGRPVQQPWFSQGDFAASQVGALLGTVNGGCFCEHCQAKAKALGYDWESILADVRALRAISNANLHGNIEHVVELHTLLCGDLTESGLLMEYPGLYQWLSFRMECVTGLLKEIHESVLSANPKADFRYNNYLRHPEYAGLDFRKAAPYLTSVRDSDYSEQTGALDGFKRKRGTIMKIRNGIGPDKDIIAAFAPRPNATPELIKESIRVLSTLGVDGLSLGHYDGSTIALLDAVKQGIEEAGLCIGMN